MKLVTFTHAGRTRIGLVDEREIVELAAAVPDLSQEMCAFLRAGQPALDAARHALANRSTRLRLRDIWLEAPVQRPGKPITIGINYKEHAAEAGRETSPHPPLNFRLVTCINAPYGDMWLPSKSEQCDYELESTAVIGRRRRDYVGYTIFNLEPSVGLGPHTLRAVQDKQHARLSGKCHRRLDKHQHDTED